MDKEYGTVRLCPISIYEIHNTQDLTHPIPPFDWTREMWMHVMALDATPLSLEASIELSDDVEISIRRLTTHAETA